MLIKPNLICDIGSLDGTAAILFRKVLPKARIIAFEANPKNVKLMDRDKISKNRIEIQQNAIWNKNETLTFFIEKTLTNNDLLRRGISSTRERKDDSIGFEKIDVEAVRLDSFLENSGVIPQKIALWIDVEGASYEVIEGIDRVRRFVKLVHLEVETNEIWLGQKLEPEIIRIMARMGFVLLAVGSKNIQHDLVFVNYQTFLHDYVKVRSVLVLASLMTFLKKFGRKLLFKIVR
jgi:FkbM family methyltransferase